MNNQFLFCVLLFQNINLFTTEYFTHKIADSLKQQIIIIIIIILIKKRKFNIFSPNFTHQFKNILKMLPQLSGITDSLHYHSVIQMF